jgi:FtsZ-binding cell division protein ZapB|tara:strand:- start:404 stop:586 length:183 start_codon:yes stop_codon:yes gene_type:complete
MSYQKRNQLLEIISEYKSDTVALKRQNEELKKQIEDAEARIKRLLIRCENFVHDNNKESE